jgi:TP901 family phage tail tape measure protein
MSRQIESKTIFSAVDRISPVTAKIAQSMKPLSNQLSKVSDSLKSFGSSAVFKSGAGLGGIFLGAIKPAMNFEKAMANVFKVLDDSHFKKFKLTKDTFSSEVLKMSGDMAIDAVSMAQVFENMPLVSLKNQEELLGMAKLVGQSIKTMGIDAVYAGESVKTFYNILGNDYGATQKAINAVNALGNRFGSKPADILESARIGALAQGTGLGLSPEHTLSFATSFIQLGATPERAKTSFDHLTNALIKSSSATKDQKEAFKMLGLTAEKATKMFLSDKSGTITDIFTRLSKLDIDKQGIAFIKMFGLEGLNNIKALQKNLPLLQEAFKTVGDPLKYSNSIQEEYFKLSIISAFKIEKAWEKINNTIAKVTNLILPAFGKIADGISNLADKYDTLSPETKKLIGDTLLITTGLLSLGVAVGGVSYALGGLATAMGVASRAYKLMGGADMLMGMGGIGGGAFAKSKSNWQKLGEKKNATGWTFGGRSKLNKANLTEKIFGKGTRDISQASFAVSKMVGVVGIAITAFEVLTATVAALALPLLPVIGVLALVGATVYTMYKRWDEFKVKFKNIGNAFKFFAGSLGMDTDKIGDKFKSLGDIIENVFGSTLLWVLDRISEALYGLSMMSNIVRHGFSEGGRRNDNILAWKELSESGKLNGLTPDFSGEKSPNQVKIAKSQQEWLNTMAGGLYKLKKSNDNMKIVVEILGDKNAKVTTNLNGKNVNQSMATGNNITPTLNYSPSIRGK